MTQATFDRSVVLEPDCLFVPIRRVRTLIGDAITVDAAFNFGYHSSNDSIARVVFEWRRLDKLRVFEAGGLGVIRDDNVLRGTLKREDFVRLLADEWNMGLLDGLPGDAPRGVSGASGHRGTRTISPLMLLPPSAKPAQSSS